MNKQQKLKQTVRKLTKPVCEDCGGAGKQKVKPTLSENGYHEPIDCNTCNGKGYIEEFNVIKLKKVTRLELINHSLEDKDIGRLFVSHDIKNIELSFQDDGKTLKIFV